MKYFAYGSNMSLARLRARVPGAQRIGLFYLRHHDLRFHKAGKDGSGKCDALQTRDPAHWVAGSLFEISRSEKTYLDHVEGLGFGYQEKKVLVEDARGVQLSATTYFATWIDQTLKPFSWYKNHVLVGARESALPDYYIHRIDAVETVDDLDEAREAAERAIHG